MAATYDARVKRAVLQEEYHNSQAVKAVQGAWIPFVRNLPQAVDDRLNNRPWVFSRQVVHLRTTTYSRKRVVLEALKLIILDEHFSRGRTTSSV